MDSLIKAGFTPVRFIGNPCMNSACSFAMPSERCARCIAYAQEKEKEKEKEEKKEERIVYTSVPPTVESVPLTVEKARKGPLLTQRRYTLHNMVFSDFNELRYRDVIRVHRGSYLGEHDTLVVLTNGKLLRVKCWKGKTQTLAHYDTIFQYLVELTSNDCGFNCISLNKKACDPNYPSLVRVN